MLNEHCDLEHETLIYVNVKVHKYKQCNEISYTLLPLNRHVVGLQLSDVRLSYTIHVPTDS